MNGSFLFGSLAVALSLFLIFLEILFTYREHTLTSQQLFKKYPTYHEGRPFLWHGGLWGDIFILTPLFGWILAMYASQWNILFGFFIFAIGFLLSALLHWMYISTPFPDSLAWGGKLSIAGWLHLIYMSASFAILGLFYFATDATLANIVFVSIVVAIHVGFGTHVVLTILNRAVFHQRKFPDRISALDTWLVLFGTWIAIGGLALFAFVY